MIEFSPYAYDFHEDPYPIYAALREKAPVYHNTAESFWALSRHRDVLAAFKDSGRFSNIHGVSIDPAARGPGARAGMSFLGMDPPEHTRFRGIVAIESYSKEREMEAAGDNKRVFERLMEETDNVAPGL